MTRAKKVLVTVAIAAAATIGTSAPAFAGDIHATDTPVTTNDIHATSNEVSTDDIHAT
ncbi:hypothetical protein [Streptomyces sp. V4I2]|uniref:hypothetical protein n=1 Tax=Streptomyces sp. V4I2 TaxID=3042280 RepID=UPI00278B7788|nr:hypothetical protein [Streptomyces sp. V4I2]MDQ1046436.1 hypothetical protein [Streptomyces sp. V4I2]